MLGTLSQIYREEGLVRGLYRGMSINYLRAIPMVAVSFTTYELMKQLLELDTGIKMEWSDTLCCYMSDYRACVFGFLSGLNFIVYTALCPLLYTASNNWSFMVPSKKW